MSDNNQRRKAAMQSLEKEIKSRDRAEKMKPLGVVTAAAVAIVVIVGGIIFATNTPGMSISRTRRRRKAQPQLRRRCDRSP